MASQRRVKDYTEVKIDRHRSDSETAPVRSAWRATWSGDTHIVIQSRPFSTIVGIMLILYCSVFALMRLESPDGTSSIIALIIRFPSSKLYSTILNLTDKLNLPIKCQNDRINAHFVLDKFCGCDWCCRIIGA